MAAPPRSSHRRPRGLIRLMMRAPLPLYRFRLGRRSLGELLLWALFWHPHIRVVHTGRATGQRHQTILEVIRFDQRHSEWIVASMFGPTSDWYRNVQATPAMEVEVDGTTFQPNQRMLGDEAAQAELDDYRRRNPIWSKVVGALIRRPFTASSMPVVGFSQGSLSDPG